MRSISARFLVVEHHPANSLAQRLLGGRGRFYPELDKRVDLRAPVSAGDSIQHRGAAGVEIILFGKESGRCRKLLSPHHISKIFLLYQNLFYLNQYISSIPEYFYIFFQNLHYIGMTCRLDQLFLLY